MKMVTHQWEELKKVTNIDFIHESTYQKKQDERREFEKTVMRIAEKDGLILQTEGKQFILNFILHFICFI